MKYKFINYKGNITPEKVTRKTVGELMAESDYHYIEYNVDEKKLTYHFEIHEGK